MKLLDSISVIASLDPKHQHYRKAVFHLQRLRSSTDVFIPCVVLHECELVLRRRFSLPQVEQIMKNLSLIIPKSKIIPVDAETHSLVNNWKIIGQSCGGDCDTLIACLAYQNRADIISNDASFRRMGITTIW